MYIHTAAATSYFWNNLFFFRFIPNGARSLIWLGFYGNQPPEREECTKKFFAHAPPEIWLLFTIEAEVGR